MLLFPKTTITYGPVRSRRLGRSLGINLLPGGRKVCDFDCQYCQYGYAPPIAADACDGAALPTADQVQDAVAAALEALPEPPAWLTFSGNGEPTLHPRFAEIVERVRDLRDRLAPAARTAVLSNSSRVGRPAVRDALARLDARIMKLDAGTEAGFRRFNGPAPGITLEAVVCGLKSLGRVTLQSLFAGGPSGNLDPTEHAAWLEAVIRIRPVAVQLYTLAREAPNAGLAKARPEQLEELRDALAARGIVATVY